MSDGEIPSDTCYTCNVSPSAAEARGREQGRREAVALLRTSGGICFEDAADFLETTSMNQT